MTFSRRTLLTGAAALLAAVAGAPALRAQGGFTLVGRVTRSGGSPRQGVEVGFEPGGYFALTDRNGRFVVHGFQPGHYVITLRQGPRYQTFNRQVEGSTLELTIDW